LHRWTYTIQFLRCQMSPRSTNLKRHFSEHGLSLHQHQASDSPASDVCWIFGNSHTYGGRSPEHANGKSFHSNEAVQALIPSELAPVLGVGPYTNGCKSDWNTTFS